MDNEFYRKIIMESSIPFVSYLKIKTQSEASDYKILECNQAFCSAFRFSYYSIVNKLISGMNADTPFTNVQWVEKQIETNTKQNDKFVIVFLEKYNSWYKIAVDNSQDEVFSIFLTDLSSEYEKIQELEGFFSVNLDLLCIADTDGNFIKLNESWKDVLGYSLEEILQHKFLDFVHPDDLNSTLRAVAELDGQRDVKNFTNRYIAKDGSEHFIEWKSHPKGKLIYAAARDITERVEIDRKLQQSEEYYRVIFNQTPVGLISIDKDGVIVSVNDKLCEIMGSSKAELIGFDLLKYLKDQDLLKAIRDAVSGIPSHFEGIYETVLSSKKLFLKMAGQPILNYSGEIRAIGIFEDISERKMSELALIESKAQFQKLIEKQVG